MTIARSRDLAALSAEPLFAVNHEQRIVAWNGAAADLFGNQRSDVLLEDLTLADRTALFENRGGGNCRYEEENPNVHVQAA